MEKISTSCWAIYIHMYVKNVHESIKTRMAFLHGCEVENLDGRAGYEAMLQ